MKVCLGQETLQAVADRQLPLAERNAVEAHLESCAACRERFEEIRETNLEVREMMDAMAPAEVPEAAPPAAFEPLPERETAAVGWAWVASTGAMAACALIGLAIYRHSTPAIGATPSVPAVPREVAAIAPEISKAAPKPLAHRHAKAIVKSAAARQETMEFIPLDDGAPIQSGTIMRIDLGVTRMKGLKQQGASKKIPADVLLDDQGEVRAIRFLNGAQ
jgi:anti-sigma factor RsiW